MTLRLDSPLHPPIDARESGMLPVGDGCEIYWEEVGAHGAPALCILHGGPGGGVRPYYRQLFDPSAWRAILFEQRGCGRSTPNGRLEANTTQNLVSDMERLRVARGVDRWVVLGGSWGSTLALAYAEAHPDRCAGLIVTGVFLARAEDREWWWRGARALYPELWADLNAFIPKEEQGDLRDAYLRRILTDDPEIHVPALRAMLTYETQLLDVLPNPARLQGLMESPSVVAMGRIFAHYERHEHFLTENQLIENADRLASIPGYIINGRFDACTPPSGAFDLSKAWPRAQLRLMPISGHAWNDPVLGYAISEALVALRR